MTGAVGSLTSIAMMWIATVLQTSLADKAAVWGARPDFVLAFLAPMALLSRPSGGAVLGGLGGLAQGAMAGANVTHYVLSGAATGFGCAAFRLVGLEMGVILGGVVAAIATIVGQLLLMLLAPPPSIPTFLGATIGMAMYNGVLAMPLYALLKRLFKTKPA